ncbi:MAG: hypothetical protein R3F41_15560 [Gammaproteobacteria bacterium]|nr:hypothetical protein [Pseudomonadales bacterium]
MRIEDYFRISPELNAKLSTSPRQLKVLVVGVVLGDRINHYRHISTRLNQSKIHKVQQTWAVIKSNRPIKASKNVKLIEVTEFVPRSLLINRLLKESKHTEFDLVILVDDDIRLPKGFLDQYIEAQLSFDFSIAQPARTPNSVISHDITRQRAGLLARQTQFVEIGPLVSFRKDAYDHVLPLDEDSPMGWGLDFVWPVIMRNNEKKMGIIDFAAVAHTLRPTAGSYDNDRAKSDMERYLESRPHLNTSEAFQVVAEFTEKDIINPVVKNI